jgi:hypothetical protein
MAERESDRVCLLLEKSRSTEMLTPGMARISRAMSARMGKSAVCICRETFISIDTNRTRLIASIHLPPLEDITIKAWVCAAEKGLDFRYGSLLLIGCEITNRIQKYGC